MLRTEEKKKYLNRYRKLVKECSTLEAELFKLRAEFEDVKSMVYDDMPKGGNKKSIEDYLDEIMKLEKLLLKTKKEALRVYAQIETLINTVEDDTQRLVLRLRYLQGKIWKSICEELAYSWSQTHKYHREALNNLKIAHNRTLKSDTI